MDEAADIVARMQRFNEAARAYTPPSPSSNAKLAPSKDGIVQLRERLTASYPRAARNGRRGD
jgi:hypothetical protein